MVSWREARAGDSRRNKLLRDINDDSEPRPSKMGRLLVRRRHGVYGEMSGIKRRHDLENALGKKGVDYTALADDQRQHLADITTAAESDQGPGREPSDLAPTQKTDEPDVFAGGQTEDDHATAQAAFNQAQQLPEK